MLAVLVVVILQQLLSEDELRAWGWRIPFVIGAITAVIALWLRRSLNETASNSEKVNPNGGAIALGHPLGMSGARLVLTALHQLEKSGGRRGLATMCVGVGQGLALAIERV